MKSLIFQAASSYLRVAIHDLSTDRIRTTEIPLRVNLR